MGSARFDSLRIERGESDLWLAWPRGEPGSYRRQVELQDELKAFSESALELLRQDIKDYASRRSGFLDSLAPLSDDGSAPPIARAMLRAALAAGVGPMAAVAGAIAQSLGNALKAKYGFTEIVVENGGDLWIDVQSPLTVAVYAGLSSLSQTFGIVVEAGSCGLACSSGTVGPSLSFGKADAAVVISSDAAAADAWATSLGNKVKRSEDLEQAPLEILKAGELQMDEELKPRGALVVMADRFSAAGRIRLAPLRSSPS